MERSPRLGRWGRHGLILLGLALIAAALGLGYLLLIHVVVGLTEPVHLTGLETAFVAAELLVPFPLLATGLVALACTNRRRLRWLGGCALLVAANVAIALALNGPAMREWCAGHRPVPGEIDTSDCAGWGPG